jgi:peroxiredoxin
MSGVKQWLIAAALLFLSASAAPPRVGERAPDFRLLDQNSRVVRLSAARGHKVVLVFYRGFW